MNTNPLKDLKPEDASLAQKLGAVAEQINPNPFFESQLDNQLQERFASKKPGKSFAIRQFLPSLGWIALAVALVALTTFMFRNLLPGKTTQPGIVTEIPFNPTATDTPVPVELATPTVDSNSPSGQNYDWRGTQLTLVQPLPESPAEAKLYQLKPEQKASLEEARALANRFGLDGEVYQSASLYPGKQDYFFTDGKQSLAVMSDLYFAYTSDMAKAMNNFVITTDPNAEELIGSFLKSHGFDFPYKIEIDSLYGGYSIEPLSPDRIPMRYEYYSSRPLLVTLDENGQVLRFEANLMDTETVGDKKYDIISAKEAFQQILAQDSNTGMIEAVHSATKSAREWRRSHRDNQPVTIHGYASSIPALDAAKPSFIMIDAMAAIGNTSGMESLPPNTYVEALGQFITENDIRKFTIDSWKVSKIPEDGFIGTIQHDGQNTILSTDTGTYILPDIPGDMPLPFESAYVVGAKIGNTIDWTIIDDRMVGSGGGGGGGGGMGFYKLNLSGTPVPFPTPTPHQGTNSGGSLFVVKAGDTLEAIAQYYGISVGELMKANNISNPDTIYVDQQLIIPDRQSTPEAHPFEKQRGMLIVNIYKRQDGSQRVEYGFSTSDPAYPYLILEGNNLDELRNYHNRPVDIWGVTEGVNTQGMPIVKVDRFEIPFPDLKFQIMKGTEKNIDVQGKSALLFTSEDGTEYVQLAGCYGLIGSESMVGSGKAGEEVLLEALAVPDLTMDGYPALCVFSTSMAISPKNGQPIELTVTADQPYVMDEPAPPQNYTPPTATIDKVELIYFVTNQHWQVNHLDGGPQYIQPVWKFNGHYSNGDGFEILVQALKQDYLLPERAPYIQGG